MSDRVESSRSARLLNPAPQELKGLVLDFIVHNCYTNTARAFVRESGLKRVDADGDEVMDSPVKEVPSGLDSLEVRLVMGKLRKDIRAHILTGRIDEATVLLNTHFPSVLSESMEDSSSVPPEKLEYLPSTSVNPAHLSLNLRIQAFIEAARTIPLLYYPPGSKHPVPHPPLLSAAMTKPSSSDDEDVDMPGPDAEAASEQLLHRAQNLYSETNQLTRPEDRARYLLELGQVGGLLAYKVPEKSPLAAYMTQRRREGVADQIDSAILYRAKRPVISRVELYTRYMTTVWGVAHELNVKVPPRSTWPADVYLPPSNDRLQDSKAVSAKDAGGGLDSATPGPKKPAPETDADEILPAFDLRLFLESHESR